MSDSIPSALEFKSGELLSAFVKTELKCNEKRLAFPNHYYQFYHMKTFLTEY